MTAVLVLIPRGVTPPLLPEGAMFVPFQTAFDAVISLRASDAPAVLVTDGLDAEDLDSLAAALRERSGPCVEVRLAAWDGETHSAVSGVCRGVISGFGQNGIKRAIDYLSK
ncbi:MAG: hypothetical protein ABI577_04665 [bacterium]